MVKAYFFNLAEITESCGSFTYELIDQATNDLLDPAIFQVEQPLVRGSFPTREPYLDDSPLILRIKTSVEFGGQEALSDPLVITVTDPCFDTELETMALNDMASTVNAPDPVI